VAEKLDLVKFTHIVAMIDSAHDGEATNAWRLASRMLKAAGRTLADFIAPFAEAETLRAENKVATDAVEVLLAENQALRGELDALRSTGTAVAPWVEVAAPGANHRTAAQWALGLYDDARVWLTDREREFLGTCSRWTGQLRPKQREWFDRLMTRIVQQTGMSPPP
jgi:hypothetical protein